MKNLKKELSKLNTKPATLEESWEVIAKLFDMINEIFTEQQAVIESQQKTISSLQERLGLNSKNSSLPPSRDQKKK